ncbi:hypothetical protein [Yinghuangia seranimata]|uniref:hypothetical protein n=1 Tax=Yinghuangia seranimata TaxID=408067 RepID=UPI00248C552F|nr:hypothetical protein [Yinghuangia seranimata]MDI2131251.1 hypothetical protein [Yinghuangia seranimata]
MPASDDFGREFRRAFGDDYADLGHDAGSRQDPELARALRDLDLPGPAVPRWSAREVRARGTRRRTRRHLMWSGAGLVAAALVGAVVVGPLTPDRGPSQAAVPDSAQAAAPWTGPATPSGDPADATSAPLPGGAPAEDQPTAQIDLQRKVANLYDDTGHLSGEPLRIYENTMAGKVVQQATHLQVTNRSEAQLFTSEANGMGDAYNIRVPWVVELKTDGGAVLYFAAPTECQNQDTCDDPLPQHALIGTYSEDGARAFYEEVEIGDTVELIGGGVDDTGGVTPPEAKPSTPPPDPKYDGGSGAPTEAPSPAGTPIDPGGPDVARDGAAAAARTTEASTRPG